MELYRNEEVTNDILMTNNSLLLFDIITERTAYLYCKSPSEIYLGDNYVYNFLHRDFRYCFSTVNLFTFLSFVALTRLAR